MDFYYPNRQNDFWRIMGLVFFDNKLRFYDEATRTYRLDDIKRLLTERGIARLTMSRYLSEAFPLVRTISAPVS